MFASNEEDHEGFYKVNLHGNRDGSAVQLGCLCFGSTCFGCLLLPVVKNEAYCRSFSSFIARYLTSHDLRECHLSS